MKGPDNGLYLSLKMTQFGFFKTQVSNGVWSDDIVLPVYCTLQVICLTKFVTVYM